MDAVLSCLRIEEVAHVLEVDQDQEVARMAKVQQNRVLDREIVQILLISDQDQGLPLVVLVQLVVDPTLEARVQVPGLDL